GDEASGVPACVGEFNIAKLWTDEMDGMGELTGGVFPSVGSSPSASADCFSAIWKNRNMKLKWVKMALTGSLLNRTSSDAI
ncbi:MAG: hypothetical protein GY774_30545, partial [Planctomycetes bacterium]|nr:hypothetical protein [Planctomycetota bacterium]